VRILASYSEGRAHQHLLPAWLAGNAVPNLPTAEPQFWTGTSSIVWSVFARVNNATYALLGGTTPAPVPGASTNATVVSGSYTSTNSIFVLQAGGVTFTLDFFSPVSPKNYVRQSMPFSYLTVTANASTASVVQIYSDIDGSWAYPGPAKTSSYTTSGTAGVYQVQLATPSTYGEATDMALWGQAVYATASDSSPFTYQAGDPATVRGQFVSSGTLTGVTPAWTYGAVTGFSHQLGSFSGSKSVQFAVGFVREQAINYLGAPHTGYYRSKYANTVDAVVGFFADYSAALAESKNLHAAVIGAATSTVNAQYADIISLSVRQAFGGTDLVIPESSLDTSKARMFMKEISSDGNVNTLDVIFPAYPIFRLVNPEYLRMQLEPLLSYMQAGLWPHNYAVHDLGSNYPNATGHNLGNAEFMPLESTGDLIMLTLAYQQASGNTAFAKTYQTLLTGYANYLSANGTYPILQFSTNDVLGQLVNQTNLAIKSAVGLTAFGALYGISSYTSAGVAMANKISTLGLGLGQSGSSQFYNLQYGSNTWFMGFNLVADYWLGLSTFPSSANAMQSAIYGGTGRQAAGVPLDGAVAFGKTDWQMWSASASSTATRNQMVADLHAYISNGINTAPLSDRYLTQASGSNPAGTYDSVRNRPTVGGHFGLLMKNPSAFTSLLG
jgi:hypothetical protein